MGASASMSPIQQTIQADPSSGKGAGVTTQPTTTQPTTTQPAYTPPPPSQSMPYNAPSQVYQPTYTQPTYNPMGGNTGMTGGNMYSQPTFSQGYNNLQGPQAIQQPMYQNYGYQQQQPYQQQPQGGFQQQPMGGGKGGAQAQPAPQPMQTSAPGGKGGGQMQQPAPQPMQTSAPGGKGAGTSAPTPTPVDTSGTAAPGGKGGGTTAPATPTASAAPITGDTSTPQSAPITSSAPVSSGISFL